MPGTSISRIKIILFDLGGVLVELDQRCENTCWFNRTLSIEDNWLRWITSSQVQAFECGQITAHAFAEHIIKDNQLSLNCEQFFAAFKRWVVGFYPETWALLDQLQTNYRLAVFSNISELHWPPLFQQLKQHGAVTDYFASYLIGRAKPDPDSFLYVADQLKTSPESILFLDDNQINVDGAQTAGMMCAITKGPREICSIIERFEKDSGRAIRH